MRELIGEAYYAIPVE